MTFCLFFFVLSDLAFRWPGGIRFRNDTGRILFDCCFFGNLEPTLIILRVMNFYFCESSRSLNRASPFIGPPLCGVAVEASA